MTPLHVAIEAADSECVEKLLAAGSKADTSNTVFGEGSTCLHNAAGRGLTGVVKLLLDHQSAGLDVNAPNAEVRCMRCTTWNCPSLERYVTMHTCFPSTPVLHLQRENTLLGCGFRVIQHQRP